jgi:phosphoglycerate dehydrogenase-like enzyme
MSTNFAPVLVLHDSPEQVRSELDERFAQTRFVYVTTADDIPAALEQWQPEVVLSIKCPTLPGPCHRIAATYESVKWLHVGGSGFDHILPLDERTPAVTNSAGVLSGFLGETVTGAMLALNGNFLRYQSQANRRQWRPIPFRPLCDQTLLVVGMGNIGECVARNASALGMRVLGTRRTPKSSPYAERVLGNDALPSLLPEADFVSLHVRLDDSSHHLFDHALIAAMRPGSVLINTARGPVVDEKALIDALDNGHLGGAYLDVFETEPLPETSPLWGRDNVLLTPHAADQVLDWPTRFAAFFADNLERWQRGEVLENVVHQP